MATATPTPAPTETQARPTRGDQVVEWVGIGWEGYMGLLKVQGEKARPQIIYLEGDVILMSPSHIHESLGDRLGSFVREVFVGLEIPCIPAGETTFKSHKDDVGVQPDQSYYFANHPVIAAKNGKEDIDLRYDPPPDLVIEVVHTHQATDALKVLRKLKVPEVWVCNSKDLRILLRTGNGRYVASKTSGVFSFLSSDEIFGWVTRPALPSMMNWIKDLRQWVQDVLIPRVQEQGG